MQSLYEVRIEGKNTKRFIKKVYSSGIYIEDIEMNDKVAYLKLTKENYEKLKKIKTVYKVEIVRLYGIIRVIDIVKRNSIFFLMLGLGDIYLIILSNIVFNIEVIHSKKEIRDLVNKELKYYGIEKYNFVKSYKEKEEIEKEILEAHKDKLEWLEIERIGTKYEIRVEERIIKRPNVEEKKQNIVAKKDGIIIKIQASKGEIKKKIGDYVKKGDVIISGSITKDEEVKNQVSAKGSIYAEVWYKTSVDMPYYYKEENKTGKRKKVLKFRFLNKDFYLLNFNKYKNYEEKSIFSLKNNILPIRFSYALEEETNVLELLYSPEEAIEAAKELSDKKVKNNLKDGEKIISSKVLSTNEQENYVRVTMFYKIMEEISDTEEIKKVEEKIEEKSKTN